MSNPAFVQSAQVSVGSGTGATFSFGDPLTAGNSVVVIAGWGGNHNFSPDDLYPRTTMAVTDDGGNIYNEIFRTIGTHTLDYTHEAWLANNVNAGSPTITITPSAVEKVFAVALEYNPNASGLEFDVGSGQTQDLGRLMDSGSTGVLSTTPEVVIAFGGFDNYYVSSFSAVSPSFTKEEEISDHTNQQSLVVADQVVSATTAIDATASYIGSTQGWTFSVIALKQVSSVITVDVAPDNASISTGGTQQFTATVAGTPTPSQAVVWSTDGGRITDTGLYFAPNLLTGLYAQTNAPYPNRVQLVLGANATYNVTATSVADPTKSDTVPVIVDAPVEPLIQNGPLGAFDPARDLRVYVDGVPVPVLTSYFDALNSRYLLYMSSTFNLRGVIQVIHHVPSPPFYDNIGVPFPGFAILASYSAAFDPYGWGLYWGQTWGAGIY